MRTILPYISLICLLALLIPSCKTQKVPQETTPQHPMTNFDNLWHQIDSLESKGLYRSALEITESIHETALAQSNDPQWIKAVIYLSKYAAHLNEDGLVHAIERMESAVKTAGQPAQSVMYSLTARLYAVYLQQNAWTLQDRTNVDAQLPADLRSWDVAQLIGRINAYYFASLENPGLKELPVTTFETLLTEADTDTLRPTLFDLLAHQAIDYFRQDYGFMTEPAYAFRLTDLNALEPAGDFVSRSFDTPDERSYQLKTLKLFQDLLRLHLDDSDPSARVDVDLQRLAFVHQRLQHEAKDERYERTLREMYQALGDQEEAAITGFYLAQFLYQQGQSEVAEDRMYFVEANAICEEVISQWPEAYGTAQCSNLQRELQRRNLYLKTEQVWLPGAPIMGHLTYRNHPQAFVRIVRLPQDLMQPLTGRTEEILGQLKGMEVMEDRQVLLPGTADLRQHTTEFVMNALVTGHYAMLVSDDESFSKSSNTAYVQFHVSRLAYWSESDGLTSQIVVVDRISGEMLPGVDVEFYQSQYNSSKRRNEFLLLARGITNKDGVAVLPVPPSNRNRQVLPRLIMGEDRLFTGDGVFSATDNRYDRSRTTALIYTDRAIYRPGQTVHFKGYLLQFDQSQIPTIRSHAQVEVQFIDVNGQEIDKRALTSNTYGTFSGTFTTPEGRLLGQMSIRCNPGNGHHGIQVEEYKRPTFEVTFDEATDAYALDDSVSINGMAMSFAGVPIDGASYKYRVVRSTYYPYWPWWRIRPLQSGEMEIAQGEGQTSDAGAFDIDFLARSEQHAANARAEYAFTVEVDVTDISGETRSTTKRIILGDLGFRFRVNLENRADINELDEVALRAENLNGEPVEVSGAVTVERLEAPDRPMRDRYWPVPDQLTMTEAEYQASLPQYAFPGKESIHQWDVEAEIGDRPFALKGDGQLDLAEVIASPGPYRLTFKVGTSASDTTTITRYLHCTDMENSALPAYLLITDQPIGSLEPGQDQQHQLLANRDIKLRYAVDRRSARSAKWIDLSNKHQEGMRITEQDRGGYHIYTTFVYDGRVYASSRRIRVPWTNKQLRIEYLSFRDKTEPGAEEEWRLRVTGTKTDGVIAEMLATMYDASLDAFAPHQWNMSLYPDYYSGYRLSTAGFNAVNQRFLTSTGNAPYTRVQQRTYRQMNWFNFPFYGGMMIRGSRAGNVLMETAQAPEAEEMAPAMKDQSADSAPPPPDAVQVYDDGNNTPEVTEEAPPLQIRRDLQETVFFFPHLVTGDDGAVELRFKMRESLTRWKFLALAHTKDLAFGLTEKLIETQKEIMVFPFVPRFVRQKDTVRVTAKVNNQADTAKQVTVRLQLENMDGESVLRDVLATDILHTVRLEEGRSADVEWTLEIPAGFTSPLTYRVIATSGNKGDGEEGVIPVLTDRMFVTETMAMFVPASSQREFTFAALRDATSVSLVNHRFTLEFTSNPAWYAVQALPYLQEYPHACSEQEFNRLYANLLGKKIVGSFPQIQAVFERWSTENPDALLSPLSKNAELKSALLEETPWVRAALSEEEQRKNLAVLMDLQRLANEAQQTLDKLREMQLSNGGFPWFSGGRDNWYITQYIVESAGHLTRLGAIDPSLEQAFSGIVNPAIRYIDLRFMEYYQELVKRVEEGKTTWDDNHLNSLIIHYLYARSFYQDQTPGQDVRKAMDYFLGQSEQFWPDMPLYTQGLIALSLHRWTQSAEVATMLQSFEERSLYQEELGRYWKESAGYYWYQLPIERQALMIEVFSELRAPATTIDELRLWLLTNKQTNRWNTTKATSSAVYALLMHADSWLEGAPVTIEMGRQVLELGDPESGSLYVKYQWDTDEVQAQLADIRVDNPNRHVAWGGAYWQYFEDIDKVQASDEGPLSVTKQVFRQEMTDTGPVLVNVNEGLNVGDKLVIRIELTVDRDMEFVHLKDMRGSGLEPVNVLSGYRWKGGLGYYESTGDLATNFFFDRLPRGRWVFEYPLRVAHAGRYSNGIATLQCMYAPEFSSHSASIRLDVER